MEGAPAMNTLIILAAINALAWATFLVLAQWRSV